MVFNNEAFIKRTLFSILKNDTTHFDVVINDDCSTDNSVTVIEDFLEQNKDKTRHWNLNINKANLGINQSIRNILKTYKNGWVKWLAGDDEFELDSLTKYFNLAVSCNPETSIILSDMSLIDEDSKIIGKRKSLSSFFYENKWLKTANLYINTINAPSVMAGRKNILSALKETNAKNAEDWPILRFFVSRNFDFKIFKSPLVKYRLHASSLSSSYNSLGGNKKNINKIIDQVEILLNENNHLANSFLVRFGIYNQLKVLKAKSYFMQFVFKVFKLFNIQFCIFRILALLDTLRR